MTADNASKSSASAPTEPIHIDGRQGLDDVAQSYDVVLTDFHADWCGPCKMLEPIVESIAADTDAAVAKVDVDANQELAAAYGVRGVPTLVLFANGEQAEEIVGVRGEDELRSLIEQYQA